MLYRIPAHLPPLSAMLADLGHPSADQVARALDVTPRTVRRWVAADDAPRCAGLALFWVTRWGWSAVDADAVNAAQLYGALARSRADEVATLRAELARVLALADTGAANVASLQALPMAQVFDLRAAGRRPTGV